MKNLKFIAISLLVVVSALSFMSRNNFNPNGFELFNTNEGMVSVKDFRSFVQADLVSPIFTCYSKAYPNAFMTKCYSHIYFEFSNKWQGQSDDELLYANHPVNGNIVFDNCGQIEHICSIQATYDTKEIKVQESFLSEWISKDAYLDSFCKQMEKVKAE